MPSTLYNVELWREYAAQMRALSKGTSDPRMKQQLLGAVAGFDRIANLASKLQATNERPKTRQ